MSADRGHTRIINGFAALLYKRRQKIPRCPKTWIAAALLLDPPPRAYTARVETILVTTAQQLAATCPRIRGAEWIALDTEFMRERTYYAKLCLVQIASADCVWLFDPLAVDIAPLIDVLYDENLLKVLHSARQDLELMYDLRGAPPPAIFDTQVAAGFVGYDDQIGYANLVEKMTGVKLDKTQTRTNWAARPLSAEQLLYAAADVTHLRTLYRELHAGLVAQGRLAWAQEECAKLSRPALYANPLDSVHLRIKQGHAFTPLVQTRLRALAMRREQLARARDLPRSWIMRDTDLIALALHAPRDEHELAAHADLKALPRTWLAEFLPLLHGPAPVAAAWPAASILTPAQQRQLSVLTGIVRQRAADTGISAALLATRKDLEALITGRRDLPVLQGWRHEVVGTALLTALTATTDERSEIGLPP